MAMIYLILVKCHAMMVFLAKASPTRRSAGQPGLFAICLDHDCRSGPSGSGQRELAVARAATSHFIAPSPTGAHRSPSADTQKPRELIRCLEAVPFGGYL